MKHTENTYIEGDCIDVIKPERESWGDDAPQTVCSMISSLSPEETKANQTLFCAAPELLKALERMVEKVARANAIQHSGGRVLAEDWSELYAMQQEARAAIARAKGTA